MNIFDIIGRKIIKLSDKLGQTFYMITSAFFWFLNIMKL